MVSFSKIPAGSVVSALEPQVPDEAKQKTGEPLPERGKPHAMEDVRTDHFLRLLA